VAASHLRLIGDDQWIVPEQVHHAFRHSRNRPAPDVLRRDGAAKPVADDSTSEGRAKNCRIEIYGTVHGFVQDPVQR
jgi:hypothetical protein